MSISKERLVIIGKLIGIYREEYRHNTQNKYTQKRFCDGICSPNTLKSIEAGGLSRFEDVYIELLKKFNLEIDEYPAIDDAINTVMNELYIAIEYYDRKKIEALTNKALRILHKVKYIVYYSEIYNLICNIKNYFVESELMETDVFSSYLNKLHIFENKYKDVIILLIMTKAKKEYLAIPGNYIKTIESLDVVHHEYIPVKIQLLIYYYITERTFDLIKLIKELEIKLFNCENWIRLLDVFNLAIGLFSGIDKTFSMEYINKVEDIIEKHEIPFIKLSEVYYNIASAFYNTHSYYEALQYFRKTMIYHEKNLLPKLIYMADCQNHLGMDINIATLSQEEYHKYTDEIKIIYKYFTINNVPPFIKQNYIMKKVLPKLKDEWFIDIFRFELHNLIEKTNHYKDLYIFESYLTNHKN